MKININGLQYEAIIRLKQMDIYLRDHNNDR